MSRVGLKKIQIPKGVEVDISGQSVRVKGPKGESIRPIRPEIAVRMEQDNVIVTRSSDDAVSKSLHGVMRNEIQNMILGVTSGFEKTLEINGVGYRVSVSGRDLLLNLGFSHPVVFALPNGIEAAVEKQTVVTIKGRDKCLVGQVAANIRALRKPEPYKGKGVKYLNERIVRKEGKTGK